MVAAAIHAHAGVTVRVSASHPEPYPARATKLGSSITPARESIAAAPHTQNDPLRRRIEASAGHLSTTTPALPLHPAEVIVRRAFVELALWSWALARPAGRSHTADVPRGEVVDVLGPSRSALNLDADGTRLLGVWRLTATATTSRLVVTYVASAVRAGGMQCSQLFLRVRLTALVATRQVVDGVTYRALDLVAATL